MEQFAKMVGAVIIGVFVVHFIKHAMKQGGERKEHDREGHGEYFDPTANVA
jgi:hypothetical protein